MTIIKNDRRTFLKHSTLAVGVAAFGAMPRISRAQTPGVITPERSRPILQQGLQFGDVTSNRGIVWSRSDRPSRLLVEYSHDERFKRSQIVRGPYALAETDFTARVDLTGLAPDRDVFVRVRFEDLYNHRALSEPVEGHFVTAPVAGSRDLHFLWSGDTAGQGWGINPDIGGMRIYETMRLENPDFFVHCGDTIMPMDPLPKPRKPRMV